MRGEVRLENRNSDIYKSGFFFFSIVVSRPEEGESTQRRRNGMLKR